MSYNYITRSEKAVCENCASRLDLACHECGSDDIDYFHTCNECGEVHTSPDHLHAGKCSEKACDFCGYDPAAVPAPKVSTVWVVFAAEDAWAPATFKGVFTAEQEANAAVKQLEQKYALQKGYAYAAEHTLGVVEG